MPNEILLILSLFLLFGGVLVFYYLFGNIGLYCWTVFATITANIEVLIVVQAFGMEQTLGNVMFATTFLVTDILSEMSGKKEAGRAVNIGILTSIFFILVSQLWLLYTPAESDFVMPSIQAVFSNTPRLMLSSLLVYAICQRFDVWAYHKWWAFTTKKCGDSARFLWLRNNGSTLISQFLNTLLFTLGAFFGIYDTKTLISIIISSYVLYIVTSLLDTPVIYLARKITPRNIQGRR
ncbi:MAG: VUT family protein [Clostridia bacterium]|nr:VUT family protein [Clostridia bacterium]NCC45010.1 VUT family protein [Clostridia bacterium]